MTLIHNSSKLCTTPWPGATRCSGVCSHLFSLGKSTLQGQHGKYSGIFYNIWQFISAGLPFCQTTLNNCLGINGFANNNTTIQRRVTGTLMTLQRTSSFQNFLQINSMQNVALKVCPLYFPLSLDFFLTFYVLPMSLSSDIKRVQMVSRLNFNVLSYFYNDNSSAFVISLIIVIILGCLLTV